MTLTIDQIKNILTEHDLLKQCKQADDIDDHDFDYISYDSRDVKPNTLFFCKGNFKPAFLTKAKEAGAAGYVSEHPLPEGCGLTQIIVKNVQKAMALLSAAYFDYPQNELFIIAYTGTKGKTTASYFTRDAMEKATGNTTALFSTINTTVGRKPEDTFKSALTTPESLDTFKHMREAVDNGMKYLVMEVSSQAYLKNRVFGLHYDVGIFLNITPDHIGENEHPTFANYLHCKEQLLVNSDRCIINAETDRLNDVYEAANATTDPQNIYLFAEKGKKPQFDVPVDFQYSAVDDNLVNNEIDFQAQSQKGKELDLSGKYKLGLPGDYNENNAAAAIIAAGLAGASKPEIQAGIADTHIPGRMEQFPTKNHGTVYVDYAHNYASMVALLSFLKKQNSKGKVIVVVGSPGNKGVDRREGFGKALSMDADVAYLTTDDPAFEDPQKINEQIDANIDHDKVKVHFILDREAAIKTAIDSGKPGDIIVIAGKGRDPYQKINGVDTPYATDAVIAKNYVEELNKNDN